MIAMLTVLGRKKAVKWALGFTAAFMLAGGTAGAQDKIFPKGQPALEGEIQNLKGGNLTIKVANGQIPVPMDKVERVEMAERADFKKGVEAVQNEKYDEGIQLLKPLVDNYLGLDVGWVAEAAGYLAEAYAESKKVYDAEQLYSKLVATYPQSEFRFKGLVGAAKLDLVAGKAADALAKLDSIVTALPKSVKPEPKLMAVYSEVYFLRGQALEKLGRLPEALESYIKVEAVYYRPDRRAQAAKARADELRSKNKDLVVN
jgi:tetratricopeptide (TPR) repeat protein